MNDLPDIDGREKRALTVFHQTIGPEFSQSFAWHLWVQGIPLMAVHNDAIRHGVIALSDVYEQYFHVLHESHSGISAFALEHYGKAVREMMRLTLKHTAEAVEVALIGCLIFAALEEMQGHYQSALTHLESGLNILAQHDGSPERMPEVYIGRIYLRHAFVRIESQGLAMGPMIHKQSTIPINKCVKRVPQTFQTITQASLAMNSLFNRVLLFLQDRDASSIDLLDDAWRAEAVTQRRRLLLSQFEGWCQAFNDAPLDEAKDNGGIALLEFYRTYLSIMLRVDLRQGQVTFEAFEKEFQDMVLLASVFLSSVSTIIPGYRPLQKEIEVTLHSCEPGSMMPNPQHCPGSWVGIAPDATPVAGSEWPVLPEPRLKRPAAPLLPKPGDFYKPSYSVGLSIVEPLHSVCVRCRNPRIRRQALQLLKMCNRKEGIWDSLICAKVAERIIDLETAQTDGSSERFLIANMQAFYLDAGRAVVYYARERVSNSSAGAPRLFRYSSYAQEGIAF